MQRFRWLRFVAGVAVAPFLGGCSSSASGARADAGADAAAVDAACSSCEVADSATPPIETGPVDSGMTLPPWDGAVLGQQCPQMQDTTLCATCEDNFCCDTQAACLGDPDCVAFDSCLRNCDNGVPDDAGVHDSGVPSSIGQCPFYCAAAHPSGLAHFAPRQACIDQYCYAPCQGSPPNGCASCIFTNCAQQFAAMVGTADGFLEFSCGANCSDAMCQTACQNQYPSTLAANNALTACLGANCATTSTCN